MTKIIILSCIIAAVCVFQTAEARLLDKSLDLGSLLGDTKNGVSGVLGNIKDMGENLQNRGQGMLDGIKNKVEQSVKVLTSPTCTKVPTEAHEAAKQLGVAFNTCMKDATRTPQAKEKLANVNNAVDNLHSNVTKIVQDFYNCRQLPPVSMITCGHSVMTNVPKLNTPIKEVVLSMRQLAGLFPNMKECYDSAVQQAAQNITKIGQDVGQCLKSVIELLQKVIY
ncbi:PREDICTED: uncharacterized protein LOC105456205 [Wasmannia auropunctata]|uniref:uncharacterized protein LOC105456205 n=1 Tax=Wasmannia auropunctata TaxID=64793 RepID=UPI0005EE540B|nr:PREDICTED: uncharacterized protein LOC105456205 [Wasmannia auropunctata]